MSDDREEGLIAGQRAAWVSILRHTLIELGYAAMADPPVSLSAGRLILEREEIIARLRSLCADFGDNDWEPKDYLPDVIDKHLGRLP